MFTAISRLQTMPLLLYFANPNTADLLRLQRISPMPALQHLIAVSIDLRIIQFTFGLFILHIFILPLLIIVQDLLIIPESICSSAEALAHQPFILLAFILTLTEPIFLFILLNVVVILSFLTQFFAYSLNHLPLFS